MFGNVRHCIPAKIKESKYIHTSINGNFVSKTEILRVARTLAEAQYT